MTPETVREALEPALKAGAAAKVGDPVGFVLLYPHARFIALGNDPAAMDAALVEARLKLATVSPDEARQ